MADDNIKLEIFFPKSDQEHRLQLVSINGAIFALFFAPLESNGPIHLYCDDWSVVLLSPIKSDKEIVVSAINIISLNDFMSKENEVMLTASKRLVKVAPSKEVQESAEKGVFHLDDDPGAILGLFKLFETTLHHIRGDAPNLKEAQISFVTSLCKLADKIEGKGRDLDLKQVLEIWGIPKSE